MSISSEITSTIENVQNAYQGLSNLGATIPQNRTIENISDCLNEIYGVLPKTSFQTEESVTLENCLKGKLDFDDGKVGFGQASQENTQGYNLLNLPDYETTQNGVKLTINDGAITLNGNSTNYTTIIIPNSTLQSLNGNYNINFEYVSGSVSQYGNINLYDTQSSQQVKELSFTNSNYNSDFSVSNVSPAVRIYWNNNSVFNNYVIKPMVYQGNYDSSKTYEPYTNGASPNPSYPQEIKCVTGNIEEVVRGKNKLKFSDVTLESHGITLQIKDNYFILNGTNDGAESAFTISNYMTPFQVNANTKLKAFQISGTASGSIINPLFRTYTNWQNQVNVDFTSSAISDYSVEATYNQSILAAYGGTYNNYKIGFMVADNLTSGDDYEPYITPRTYQLSLGNNKFYGIGDYADELLYDVVNDKVYKNEVLTEILLKSTDNWNGTLAGGVYRVNTDSYTNQIKALSSSDLSIKSTHFKASWANVIGELVSGYIIVYSNKNIFITTQFSASNMAGWKSFLDNNNVYVVTPLETPRLIEITDTTLKAQVKAWYYAQSNNGTTIIEGNGDLPMIIKVRALKGE